jgi:hypothetical protein
MGLIEQAREAWREALRLNPAYSLEHRRNVFSYKDPADFDSVVEDFEKPVSSNSGEFPPLASSQTAQNCQCVECGQERSLSRTALDSLPSSRSS